MVIPNYLGGVWLVHPFGVVFFEASNISIFPLKKEAADWGTNRTNRTPPPISKNKIHFTR